MVVSAIVGFAGLAPTYQAVLAHKQMALIIKKPLSRPDLDYAEIARHQGHCCP